MPFTTKSTLNYPKKMQPLIHPRGVMWLRMPTRVYSMKCPAPPRPPNTKPPTGCDFEYTHEDCVDAPDPDHTNRAGCAAPYIHGEVCNYQCKVGYTEDGGDKMRTCDDGAWTGNDLDCKENCDDAPDPDHTVRAGCDDPYIHDEVCNYQCKVGYTEDGGDKMRKCDDGSWTGNDLNCKECDPPPMPQNTIIVGICNPPYLQDHICNYACDSGYSYDSGDEYLTCIDGDWVGDELVCKKDCDDAPDPDHADIDDCEDPYTHGEVCTYQCWSMYTEDGGDNTRECNDGAWTGTDLECKEDCVDAPDPDHTNRAGCAAPYTHGEVCNYQCKVGYTEDGGDKMRTCDDGAWTGNDLDCKEDCDDAPEPDHADIDGCEDPYTHDEVCTYQCWSMYTEDGGDNTRRCDDGTWTGSDLDCKEDCYDPPDPANADRADCAYPYTHGMVCNYQCQTDYNKVGGDDTLKCEDGTWTGSPLECEMEPTEEMPKMFETD
ncbi:P-selectin-like [Branchiostoma floridae]|uniref:P-selectin-like n=1 Tax=Branchiostoma floridae TaxID=7739 RepID=A0A9J7LMH6_BRAFL|nr:P-selectin-like [Branchiostoma floridae]